MKLENEVAFGLRRVITKVRCCVRDSEEQHTPILKVSEVLAMAAYFSIWVRVLTLKELE